MYWYLELHTKELVSPANFIVTSLPKKPIRAEIVKKCPAFMEMNLFTMFL
jgi:hypothetical protein